MGPQSRNPLSRLPLQSCGLSEVLNLKTAFSYAMARDLRKPGFISIRFRSRIRPIWQPKSIKTPAEYMVNGVPPEWTGVVTLLER